MTEQLTIIGTLKTPYTDNFGVPRQAGLVDAPAELVLSPPFNNPDAWVGIEAHSHVWVLFLFHQNLASAWQAKVRPPRLGGNQKVGVFATRSPFRPNNIGMSACRLIQNDVEANGRLLLSGLDCLSGTPVIDIKPYVPYSDSLNDALSAWANQAPQPQLVVQFSAQAKKQLAALELKKGVALASMIRDMLALDCRPAYKKGKNDNKIYANRVYDFDVHWQVHADTTVIVTEIKSD